VWDRFSSYVQEHRRRIAAALLVFFVLGVALDLAHTVPRETRLAFDLGPDHGQVRSVALAYSCGDEAVEQARRRYPEGAPARVSDTLDLVPGRYEVRLDVEYADGHVATRQGQFDAPAEGVVVVSWQD
jgi:hypothetical protein